MNGSIFKVWPSLIALTLALSGCGGGGGNTENSPQPPVENIENSPQPPVENISPTASAGSDQTALVLTRVTLSGTGTDSDGSIVSYSWLQTSGDTVALNNADSANAYFDILELPTTEAVTFKLTVTDNLGKTASDSVTINVISPPIETVEISGTITFDLVPLNTFTSGLDYSQTKVSPARGILVEAMDASANKIGSTTTGSNGSFSLEVDADTNVRIRLSAQLTETSGPSWDVKVTDNTNCSMVNGVNLCSLYVTEGNLFNSSTDSRVRNFHMQSGWDGTDYSAPRSAAPFAILDAIYESMQKVVTVDSDVIFPPLEVHWSPKNSVATENFEDGDIGGSFYQDGKIYVLGKADSDTDEYDRHIIIHEWGHYFEDQLSRTESLGGPHSTDDRLDFRVAFSEGWANALSAIVTDDSFYRDSQGFRQAGFTSWSMDMESNQTFYSGWFNESSIQSLIYDFYDEDNDGEDNVALGFGPIYSSLVSSNYVNNPYFASIYSFTDQLISQQPTSIRNAINSLMNEQGIFGTGSHGVGETNSGGINTSLPVYKTASVGDDTRVCYVNNAGVLNKLGNSIFVTFDATTTGFYTFSVTHADAYGAFSDPDLRLYKSRIIIATNDLANNDGTAIMTAYLGSTGMHILEVAVWEEYPQLGTGNNGTACFNLIITN